MMEEKKILFSAKKIVKTFHGTQALKGVNLDVHEGEIVGLIGENGAGKSTLMKIIIGVQPQTEGTMILRGQEFKPADPLEANAMGIGMVYQEQSLITTLSVGQNLFFGHEKRFMKAGRINWKAMYTAAKDVLEEVDCGDIDPRKKVMDINFATRQMIEIAKVINLTKNEGDKCKCLILLDEPTSVLNEEEVQRLFKQIRKITSKGHSVIFVSHRMNEVLEISDHVYIFKDGENVTDMNAKDATESKLYELMVGHSSSTEYYHLDKQKEPESDVLLEVKDLGLWGKFKHVDFQLRKGEILGITGVVGSGKEEICSVICGDVRETSGQIYLKGKKAIFRSPSHALKNGILMIPMERLIEGIIRGLSVEDNIALSNGDKISRHGVISKKAVTNQAEKWIKKLAIKTNDSKELVIQLSGGNQQKVVFARALAADTDILILNHPTRGVDVGAKDEIYSLIRDIVTEGKAIILLGDTLDECISLANRVLVMRDGLVTGEFDAPADNKPSQVEVLRDMI
jgi:ribose transport system ATP-binding protein